MQRGGIRSPRARDNVGAFPKQGDGLGSCGDTWQHVGTCLALYLGLKRVRGGTRSAGYRHP
jgi:hypothetical protein